MILSPAQKSEGTLSHILKALNIDTKRTTLSQPPYTPHTQTPHPKTIY